MSDAAYEKRFSDRAAFWIVCGGITAAAHWFVWRRITALCGAGFLSVLWVAFSAVMVLSCFVSRRTDKIGSGRQRKWGDRFGGVWILFVVISAAALALLDLCGMNAQYALPSAFAAGIAALACGILEAQNVQAVHISVSTDKPLPPELGGRVRIVQITDLHLGPWTGIPLLKKIVKLAREASPDIAVVTGDVADGRLEGREAEARLLKSISPKYGTFAVTGNHDYYDEPDKAIAFMEKAGMRVLRTETAETAGIFIIGADDKDHMVRGRYGLTRSETLVLSNAAKGKEMFTLLLRHRPVVELATEGHFDLQLSGHTHGGQLFPYLTSRRIIAGRPRGAKKLKGGGLLYVSNGAGFVGPPVRFFAPPEITVIDVISARKATGEDCGESLGRFNN